MNLFLRGGFEPVTIEEVCDAADVARATFFLHFPAKEALLTEYGVRANETEDLVSLLAAVIGPWSSGARSSRRWQRSRYAAPTSR